MGVVERVRESWRERERDIYICTYDRIYLYIYM